MKYYSLTTPQQNIWNLQKYYSDTAISNLCGAIFYKEKRDSERLCRAICKFIESQSGMRLRFCEKEKPTQYISEEIEKNIPVLTFISMKEFDRYAEEFAHKPIGLAEGAMYRFVVFQVGDKSGVLFSVSHLIADAWTCALMANKVDGAYRMIGQDADFELPHADYRFFIEEEKNYRASERCQKDKAYWEKKYTVRSDGTVPFEKSPIKTHIPVADNIEAKRTTRTLPPTLEQKVKVYCRRHSVTPAALFETAVIIYLSKINPENGSITIGVPVLNRSGAKEKGTAGMFISTMPLTIEVGKEVSVPELTGRIVGEHMGIFRHQRYPYGDILQMCRERSDSFEKLSGNLYDVLVSYQNATTDTEADTKWYFSGYSEIPLAVHIDNRDGKECHTLNVDYQTRVFSEEEADHLLDRLELILGQIAEDGEKKLKDISIITDTEYRQVTETFNDTAVDYPREKCVHELFEEQAGKTPDRTALVFHDRKFTYKELDAMSNSLAHELKSKGIGRGDVVPIIAKRSWHIVVAMFAILKTGAAYMPVSPEYPEDRIISMLETTKSRIALTCGFGGKPGGVECMELETVDYEKDAAAVANVSRPEDLCYVIFTSGSTGTPKGASIDNRNVVNYCTNNNNNVCHRIVKNEYRRIVSVTNFVFDIFVTETLLPLLNGMTVYFADEEESMRQDKLAGLVEREKIEVIQTTPTKMRSFLLDKERTDYLKNFKAVILGGEAFPSELYRELREHTDAHIFNIYGPAETTVWSSNAEVTGTDITIGRPIANTQIYILDRDSNLLPIGVAGELCIAGDGVGLGYLNCQELTAERFIPNPFATEENGHGRTMYRTGDLARWRGDGELEYLGRIDTQVKIRGLRIELGEIESVMSGFPGIALCAASDKKDENGRQYLVGYYTLSGSGEAGKVNEKELRKHLSGKLPSYMIPNYFMELEAMPMTPSGKLDRKNLPVPDFKIQEESYVAPETDREKCLCRLAGELLEVEKFGKEDDFFEVGGDSLTAITYVMRAHEEGIEFSIQNVFDYPTVRQLCDFLDAGISEKVYFKVSEFEKYRKLLAENIITETFVPQKRSLGNVLLTGATGFLGAHVLDCLMRGEAGKVYCLVRSGSEDDRRGRLRETVQYYFGDCYDGEIGNRIIPLVGDIEDEYLADKLTDVVTDIQTVIHTAASVKHFGSYEYFRRVNCEGTRHVMQYAKAVGARLVHISTLSVSGNSMAEDFSVYRSEEEKQFDETSLYIGQPLDNVYIRSKFEAERVVYDAVLSGLDAKVIRVGNLTNRHSDFKFQPNYWENAFLMRAKALLEFGMLPDYLMPLYAEFSPVDKTAEGIVKIAEYAGEQSIFHVYNSRHLYYGRFLEIAHELGIPLRVVSGEEFYEALQQSLKQKGKEYIYEAFQNDLDEQGRLVYDSNIRIKSDFTLWFLKKVGFSWNETDMEYIRGYVEYFRKLGFLEV